MASPAGSDGANDVVLTGMSGRFPESDTIDEFADQLYAGVDTVTVSGRRRSPGIYGVTERCGTLKDLAHFDATFFGVHAKQAEAMDPQQRILLEVAYEAVVDAGLSPAELRGSRTGVYVSLCCTDTYYGMMNSIDPDKLSGYAVTGCCLAMAANRISYTFDLKGPSFAMDTACSASLSALAQAVEAMQGGHCDAAIVASTNLLLEPFTTLNLHRLTMLSPDGRCASFDAAGNGYVRSEAVVAVLLQRRGAARRVYATLRGARHNNDGAKEEGIVHPSGDMQRRLAQETFEAAGLRPQDVVYIEAHGPGTKVGDPLEVGAIVDVFCKDRKQPLLIGSVKSNMGHSEPASGLCSVVKVVLAMERGVIPGNLHYRTPNPDIPALIDGRVQVVSSNTKWDGGLVAVNSFGFGGSIVHVIMESEKGSQAAPPPTPGTAVPRLVVASGRTEHAVRALLEHAHAHRADAALLALLHAVHARPIAGHPYRGYRLLDDPPHEEILEMEDGGSCGARPVWFVFPGMGSQWPGMARALLSLPVFAASVARASHALRPLGVDLVHVLTEADDEALHGVTNSFVAITAVQVALVDVLREVGITPDGIVGHSFGEIGCAYADGALSAEQAVLCAYWRGRSVADAAPPPGAMAAVGLSWEEARRRCPPDVAPACHNADDNVTVSGPVASIEKFVAKLTSEGIFARRVNSCGVAFHSQYVAAVAPLLREHLQKVIPSPKPRSKRWVSTSLSHEQWDSDMGKLCSAEYHVNNLVSPVRLARALREIPERAVVVEVAPHALLAAVLRRAAPPRAVYVPLVRRAAPDAARHLLAALGKLYAAGCQPQLHRLYPRVPWPVPRGTPGLASLVRWDRSLRWGVYDDCIPQRAGDNVIECDLSRAEDAFLAGHDIDGRILFPATGYLALVWRTMARLHGKKPEETCVVFENVHFQRETIVSQEVPMQFHVNIMEGSGYFEVREGGGLAASGVVRVARDRAAERLAMPAAPHASTDDDLLPLDTDDVYRDLRLRGYNYEGVFRGIRSFDPQSDAGELAWDDNWIAFMDSMLQSDLVARDAPGLCLPTRLQRVVIDPVAQAEALARADGTLPVRVCRDIGVIASGGVEMRGVKTSLTARRVGPQLAPKLERHVFVPYDNVAVSTEDDALLVSLQLALEQAGWARVRVLEASLGECRDPPALLPRALRLLAAEPGVAVETVLLAGAAAASSAELQNLGVQVTNKSIESAGTDWHVVLAEDVLSQHSNALPTLARALAVRGTLLLREPSHAPHDHARQALHGAGLHVLSMQAAEGCKYILLGRKAPQLQARETIELTTGGSHAWVPRLRAALQRAAAEDSWRIYLWSREPDSGVLGLAACLRREPGGRALRVFHVPGARVVFAPDAPEYRAQVQRDLAVNVLRAGAWGGPRHLPLGDAPLAQVQHAVVDTPVRGELSSPRWVESEPRPAAGGRLCRVSHAAVDCRPVLPAAGALEFSGWSASGERVMGVAAARGPATSFPCDEALLWRVPAAWSLAQAATVPVAYATAYYALAVRGRVRRGEAVLVAATGSVGPAAVAVSLHAGCTVFAAASSPDERAALLDGFPELHPEDVSGSHDASFEQLVLRRTRGRGVDLVLNSLAGEPRSAAVRCLAEGGRFLEIGELDFSEPLGTSVVPGNVTFHGVRLDGLLDAPSDDPERAAVVRRVAEGIAGGAVRPLPATVFSDRQLEEAFRYAASGRHDDKVLVCVRERDVPEPMPAVPRVPLDPDRSHVVLGGGRRGLRLAGWLASRGARRLVLASRAVSRGLQARCVRRWRRAGARVLLVAADGGSPGGARRLLRDAAELAPVAGIFSLATEEAVPDGLLANLTEDNSRIVAEHTIDATQALDTASRELGLQLDLFVVFSSEASGRGRPGLGHFGLGHFGLGHFGLGHFGLADAFAERVVERRRADGLPGLAIQWPRCASDVDEEQLMGEALGVLLARETPAVVACCVPEYQDQEDTATPAQDLVQVVANILGIREPSRAPQTATLAELGMDSLMAAEVQHALHAHDVQLHLHDARALTFARLRELAVGDAPATGTSGV